MSSRTIFHVDMDSFFASCEQQAQPELRGIPIAVSGDPRSRTVCAAASKEAKQWGVKSAMTIFEARARCPHIQFVLGDPDKYVTVSRKVIGILEEYARDVEVWSIDEAFIDVTGWTARFACPECQERSCGDACGALRMAEDVKRRIREEVGEWITASIGIASNKRLAKLASDFEKPDGIVFIYHDDPPIAHARYVQSKERSDASNGGCIRLLSRSDLLSALDLRDLCGIGSRIEARLRTMGIATVGALAAAPLDALCEAFGSYGYELHDMAIGHDVSVVFPDDRAPKSVGHATTLPRDLRTREEIQLVVDELSEKVAARLRRYGYRGSTIHATIRYRDCTSRSEQTTIRDATDDGLRIRREVMQVMGRWCLAKPVRLVGVSVRSLTSLYPVQESLFSKDRRWGQVTAAMDASNERYGDWTVQRASLLGGERYMRNVAAAFRATRHLREERSRR